MPGQLFPQICLAAFRILNSTLGKNGCLTHPFFSMDVGVPFWSRILCPIVYIKHHVICTVSNFGFTKTKYMLRVSYPFLAMCSTDSSLNLAFRAHLTTTLLPENRLQLPGFLAPKKTSAPRARWQILLLLLTHQQNRPTNHRERIIQVVRLSSS